MLFISRKHLTPIIEAMQASVPTLTDSQGVKVLLRPTEDQIEAAVMLGLTAMVAMELGRTDVVWPADHQVASGLTGKPLFTPPDLQKFD